MKKLFLIMGLSACFTSPITAISKKTKISYEENEDERTTETVKEFTAKKIIGLICDGIFLYAGMKILSSLEAEQQEQLLSQQNQNPTAPQPFAQKTEKKDQKKTGPIIDGSWAGALPKDIENVIQRINNAQLYIEAGLGKVPNVLLYGPPGTGKSLLAQTIATETKLPLIKVTGGDFHNKYIGVGPERMRMLFKEARQEAAAYIAHHPKSPLGAILFIDEIEGIATARNSGEVSTEETRLINTLLDELTSIDNQKIMVIAATNLKDRLDPAVIRTGRFGLHVFVNLPSTEQRITLFQHYLQDVLIKGATHRHSNLSEKERTKIALDYFAKHYQSLLTQLAALTEGFTSSDIRAIVEQAVTNAVSERNVTYCNFDDLRHEISTIKKTK